MSTLATPRRSAVASAIYGLLDPIPYGCFVAALIFDLIYVRSPEMLWVKGAAWLITFGLLFAAIPRLVNLVQVWVTGRGTSLPGERLDFWLNLFAIAIAILNAFVHSRDAYGVMPAGVWLSLSTVVLLSIAHVAVAVRHATRRSFVHE